MRKRNLGSILAAGLLAGLLGCATPRPGELDITPRDRMVFMGVGVPPAEQAGDARVEPATDARYKLAVLGLSPTDDPYKPIAPVLQAVAMAKVATLGVFRVVPPAELGALDLARLADDPDRSALKALPGIDYVLLPRMVTAAVKRAPGPQKDMDIGYVEVTVGFQLYEVASDSYVLSETYPGRSRDYVDRAMTEIDPVVYRAAIAMAVEQLDTAVTEQYPPVGDVLMTRGGGRMAQISLGTRQGLDKGSHVEIFYDDPSIANPSARRIAFAYGEVLQAEPRTAWVEVDGYKKAGVMRGHHVRGIPAEKGKLRQAIEESDF